MDKEGKIGIYSIKNGLKQLAESDFKSDFQPNQQILNKSFFKTQKPLIFKENPEELASLFKEIEEEKKQIKQDLNDDTDNDTDEMN